MNKLFLALSLSFSIHSYSAVIKMGALAPEGTNWAKTLKSFADEVEKETAGKVKFKFWLGGLQGDEIKVLQKVRMGQMHGGVFTGKTLGDIFSDVRAMELPFNFYADLGKAQKALQGMSDYFNKGLEAKGFVGLGFYGIGNVYLVSTKKVTSLEELKGIKVWAWEGDKLVEAMVTSLKLTPVPLPITDVYSSFSTEVIDAAYGPALGISALQWNTKVKYLVDFPVAFSIGALVVSKKVWDKIAPADQVKVKTIAKKYVDEANKLAQVDNTKTLADLKKSGIEFVNFNKTDIDKADEMRNNAINILKKEVLSDSVLKMVDKYRL